MILLVRKDGHRVVRLISWRQSTPKIPAMVLFIGLTTTDNMLPMVDILATVWDHFMFIPLNGQQLQFVGMLMANNTMSLVSFLPLFPSSLSFSIDITNGINGTGEFQKNFFFILNLAIGGNWPGFNIDNNAFPAYMYVDYVRVYQ